MCPRGYREWSRCNLLRVGLWLQCTGIAPRNFGLTDLVESLADLLRSRGVRGYVTMNTLVFPDEMSPLVDVVQEQIASGWNGCCAWCRTLGLLD